MNENAVKWYFSFFCKYNKIQNWSYGYSPVSVLHPFRSMVVSSTYWLFFFFSNILWRFSVIKTIIPTNFMCLLLKLFSGMCQKVGSLSGKKAQNDSRCQVYHNFSKRHSFKRKKGKRYLVFFYKSCFKPVMFYR